ncbi:TIGR02996 domain-containing protein [Frigoriglobus tundricola]|uniref:TIGR02996 domain-containing protein n=1 Tax=Frigoriglobus tundricola TaxID=2774151 RepID=A0A6M5Z2J0_9BACT|nr:TIGR02996 domain-containing protein [Frigoriglobus tundricola]QJX00286.1 hypothetical protein FTUN_7911 [Frigoriglobus tundricola]
MDERTALLANVLSAPADDTPRLVLADWLEEHNEEALGRFVRAGVVAARFRGEELIDDPDYYTALATLTDVATAAHPALWVSELGVGPSPLAFGDWSWDSVGDRVMVRIGAALGAFTRGLLAELNVTRGEWYAVASRALVAWPIERVRVTDVPGLTFTVEPVESGWRITGRLKTPRRNVPLSRIALPAAMAPGAVLALSSADWAADQFFPDREALVQGAAKECALIVDDLKEAAGDRWPPPPRRRR